MRPAAALCAVAVAVAALVAATVLPVHGAANAPAPRQAWAFATGGRVYSSPTLSADGLHVYVASTRPTADDNTLCKVSTATGLAAWAFAAGGVSFSKPTVSADGAHVYVGSDDRHLYKVDATTGSRVWRFAMGTDVDAAPYRHVRSSPTLSSDGQHVYIWSQEGRLYTVLAATGLEASGTPHNLPPAHGKSQLDGRNRTRGSVDSTPILSYPATQPAAVYVSAGNGILYVARAVKHLPNGRVASGSSLAHRHARCG